MMSLGPRTYVSLYACSGRHATKWTAAVPGGYLKGLVDVVD
jgi:hypothetical protein